MPIEDKKCKKIRKYISDNKKQFGGGIGNWHRAESIWNIGIDGLHATIRIATHTIKYIILFVLEYYEFIWQDENYDLRIQNHCNAMHYVNMSKSDLLKHFTKCCEIQFRYDEDNPTNSSINASMFIY